jgi:putative FmdB family regulatory protein
MLTYVYECSNCENICEAKQSIKDKPLIKCQECEQDTLFRVIQTPEFFDKTPRTVGSLAEQRTRKHRGHVNEMDAKKAEEIKAKHDPWYGRLPKDKKKELTKNPEKIQRYINEGK